VVVNQLSGGANTRESNKKEIGNGVFLVGLGFFMTVKKRNANLVNIRSKNPRSN
jgi:hypothetical protein